MTPEQIWTAARDRAGEHRFQRTPTPGTVAVVIALLHGPAYGHELARRTGQHQGNVSRQLARLGRYGFAAVADTVPGVGHQEGGRPARYWALTRAGRELADALAGELVPA